MENKIFSIHCGLFGRPDEVISIELTPEMFNYTIDELGDDEIFNLVYKMSISTHFQDDPEHKINIHLKSPKRTLKVIKAEEYFGIKLIGRNLNFTISAEGNLDTAATLLLMCAPDGKRVAKEGTRYSLKGGFSNHPESLKEYYASHMAACLLGRRVDRKYIWEIDSFGNDEALSLGIINKVI
jgi:hypothetical protein